VGGSSLPAVRVEVNPTLLNNFGLGLEDVATMLASANANRPKGQLSDGARSWTLTATDQLLKAKEYAGLIVAYRKGAAVKLSDVATVSIRSKTCATSDSWMENQPLSSILIASRAPTSWIQWTVFSP